MNYDDDANAHLALPVINNGWKKTYDNIWWNDDDDDDNDDDDDDDEGDDNDDDESAHPALPGTLPWLNSVQVATMPVASTEDCRHHHRQYHAHHFQQHHLYQPHHYDNHLNLVR